MLVTLNLPLLVKCFEKSTPFVVLLSELEENQLEERSGSVLLQHCFIYYSIHLDSPKIKLCQY